LVASETSTLGGSSTRLGMLLSELRQLLAATVG
jgi:hypothetical protein